MRMSLEDVFLTLTTIEADAPAPSPATPSAPTTEAA